MTTKKKSSAVRQDGYLYIDRDEAVANNMDLIRSTIGPNTVKQGKNLERDVTHAVLKKWGAHPRMRLWRQNTGIGWFNDYGPCRRTDVGARPVRYGVPGQADYTGLILPSGRRIEMEFKQLKGKQREEQILYQQMIERMGGIYLLIHSLEEADRELAPLLGETR